MKPTNPDNFIEVWDILRGINFITIGGGGDAHDERNDEKHGEKKGKDNPETKTAP